jgi:predicted Zn-dependent protease
MRKRRGAAVATAAVVLAVACAKSPYTGKTGFSVIPEATMQKLGKQTYDDVLSKSQVERGTDDAKRLAAVGRRIARTADKPDYDWETALIKDPQVNAFCLPGGHIAFYKGILPVLQNEAAMAYVMGHETGHALAHHGAQRMTEQLGLQGALTLVDMLLQGRTGLSKKEHNLVMGALGLGAQVGISLPFSRSQEKDADVIGMMLMADAGYPPKVAVDVWSRMESATGKGPPAFLSDHPSYDQRAAVAKENLPEARKRYARSEHAPGDVTDRVW